MGSNGTRIALLAAAAVAAIALFVVLSGGDNDPSSTTTAPAASTTATAPAEKEPKDKPKPKPKPKPGVPTIEVKGGQPVGGVERLEFSSGDEIVFRVASDSADHVHFHGYDIFMDVPAGGEVAFEVPADIEGVFEVELEDTAVQIAEITVSPN